MFKFWGGEGNKACLLTGLLHTTFLVATEELNGWGISTPVQGTRRTCASVCIPFPKHKSGLSIL